MAVHSGAVPDRSTMAKKAKRGAGGNRKHGRSTRTPHRKMKHDQQPARTEKNRIRKLKKHLRRHPCDNQTELALRRYLGMI